MTDDIPAKLVATTNITSRTRVWNEESAVLPEDRVQKCEDIQSLSGAKMNLSPTAVLQDSRQALLLYPTRCLPIDALHRTGNALSLPVFVCGNFTPSPHMIVIQHNNAASSYFGV